MEVRRCRVCLARDHSLVNWILMCCRAAHVLALPEDLGTRYAGLAQPDGPRLMCPLGPVKRALVGPPGPRKSWLRFNDTQGGIKVPVT